MPRSTSADLLEASAKPYYRVRMVPKTDPGSIDSSDTALHYGQTLLHGDHVSLRAPTDEDIQALAEWRNDPGQAVLNDPVMVPKSHATMVEWLTERGTNSSLSTVSLSIFNASDQFIGSATLRGASLPARIANYSIFLGAPFVGHGYGTDATKVMVRYAFEELGLHKLELEVWAFNTRAIRSYQKAGFSQEGLRKAATFHHGRFIDAIDMSILAEDYWTAH